MSDYCTTPPEWQGILSHRPLDAELLPQCLNQQDYQNDKASSHIDLQMLIFYLSFSIDKARLGVC